MVLNEPGSAPVGSQTQPVNLTPAKSAEEGWLFSLAENTYVQCS